MKYNDNGTIKQIYVKSSDTLPIGSVVSYSGSVAPSNWLICDGSAISRTTYSILFSIIGTTYGSGDGSTTFNLPDYRGRALVGLNASDDTFNLLGKTTGEKKHTLTVTEIPAHSHTFNGVNDGTTVTGSVGSYPARIYQDKAPNWTGYFINNTGGGQAHNNVQPSIVTNYIIKVFQPIAVVGDVKNEENDSIKDTYSCDYVNTKLSTASGDTLPIGAMIPYGKATAPTNWLICDGSAISRTDYVELFRTIGTTYGVGDGSTTFNLPDKRGRVSIGVSDDYTLGSTGGEATHTLTVNEIANHSHSIKSGYGDMETTNYDSYRYQWWGGINNGWHSGNLGTGSTGGGQAHNNMPPYEVDNWIIKAYQSSGVVADVAQTKTDSDEDTYSCNYINDNTQQDITTGGEPVKAGYKIDNKDVYIKRINFGALPNATYKDVPSGLTNVKIIDIKGVAEKTENCLLLPFVSLTAVNQISLNYMYSTNSVRTQTGIDRSSFTGYVNIYFTYNS